MSKMTFDSILQQLNNGENPTPPTAPVSPTPKKVRSKKKVGSKKVVESIITDYTMAPPKRKSVSDEEDGADISGFDIHSVVEAKPDKSKLGAHSVGEGIEDIN